MRVLSPFSNTIAIAVAFSVFNFSCRRDDSGSREKALSANEVNPQLNRALVVIGDSEGIPGTIQDFNNMQNLFKEIGFVVIPVRYPTKQQLLQLVSTTAAEMLRDEQEARRMGAPGGTLAIYLTSHGSPQADTSLQGDFVKPLEILRAIEMGRSAGAGQTPIPLTRLLFFVDTCHSASNQPFVTKPERYGLSTVYESAVSWYSSSQREPSADLPQGGAATLSFAEAVRAALSAQSATMNLRQIMQMTKSGTMRRGRQTLSFCFNPRIIGDQRLLNRLAAGELPDFYTPKQGDMSEECDNTESGNNFFNGGQSFQSYPNSPFYMPNGQQNYFNQQGSGWSYP